MNLIQPATSSTIAPSLSTKDREAYVTREMDEVKDLLEDYQDVKWIYEVLVEYTLAMPQLLGRKLNQDEQSDVAGWLDKLKELDPKRRGRWDDVRKDAGIP